MTVYIVESGCCYEGGDIAGVFGSADKARLEALMIVNASYKKEKYKEKYPGCWTDGDDFVSVKEYEVE